MRHVSLLQVERNTFCIPCKLWIKLLRFIIEWPTQGRSDATKIECWMMKLRKMILYGKKCACAMFDENLNEIKVAISGTQTNVKLFIVSRKWRLCTWLSRISGNIRWIFQNERIFIILSTYTVHLVSVCSDYYQYIGPVHNCIKWDWEGRGRKMWQIILPISTKRRNRNYMEHEKQ